MFSLLRFLLSINRNSSRCRSRSHCGAFSAIMSVAQHQCHLSINRQDPLWPRSPDWFLVISTAFVEYPGCYRTISNDWPITVGRQHRGRGAEAGRWQSENELVIRDLPINRLLRCCLSATCLSLDHCVTFECVWVATDQCPKKCSVTVKL